MKRILTTVFLLALCMQGSASAVHGNVPTCTSNSLIMFAASNGNINVMPINIGSYGVFTGYSWSWTSITIYMGMLVGSKFTGFITVHDLILKAEIGNPSIIQCVFDPVGSSNPNRYSNDTVWLSNWDTSWVCALNWKLAPASSVRPRAEPVQTSAGRPGLSVWQLNGRKAGRNCAAGIRVRTEGTEVKFRK
jgi:hypothetical protein